NRGSDEVAVEHLVENTQFLGFLGGDVPPRGDEVERNLRSDEARQALRAATAGQQAERDLRQADLSALQRDAIMAAERIFQTAAEGEAVDGRDDRLLAVLQHVLGLA